MPSNTPITLRFNEPQVFLRFHQTQLAVGLVVVPTPKGTVAGTDLELVLHLPGSDRPLSFFGRVVHRTGTGSTRVRLTLTAERETWLAGYVTALSGQLIAPKEAAQKETAPRTLPEDPRGLFPRLDHLTYYELLATPQGAEAQIIQSAFHGLSRQYHPDLFYGIEPERLARISAVFRRINEAYSVLRVAERRRAYDRGLVGPRHGWRLRWSADTPELAGTTLNRGDYYWKQAQLRLAVDRPPSAPPDVQALRLLRTACALAPEQVEFRQGLDAFWSWRR